MADKRPNILLFCVDQMQSFCLGANGHPLVKTPNIDALAAEGVTFQRAYVNNPVCQPSRASMITGKTPRHHGLLTNGNKLPEHIPTVTGALRDAGYRTHAVGKLHLQPYQGLEPQPGTSSLEGRLSWNEASHEIPLPYYGFETVDFTGAHGGGIFGDYKRWLDAQDPTIHARLQRQQAYHAQGRGYRVEVPEGLHYNDWVAQRTIDHLQGGGDQPFFMWCSFPDPHFPFAASRPWSEMYDPADVPLPETWRDDNDYLPDLGKLRQVDKFGAPNEAEAREIIAQTLGMISHVDACIGKVISALKANGQWDDTVVGFIADHGEYLGHHALVTKGSFPYEALWRVPMVWRAPGASLDQHADASVVSLLDIVPTVADFAGLDDVWHETRGVGGSPRPGLAGRSLRPAIEKGDKLPARPALVEYDEDYLHTPLVRQRGLVTDRYKLVTWAGQDKGVLIDLQEDPQERHNLWDDPELMPVKCELMRQLLDELTRTDRFDTPRICGA